jgi:exosortase/archaeosortase family protein
MVASKVMEAPAAGGRPGRFLLVAAAWVAGLFGLMRIPLVQEGVLLPLTRAQAALAAWSQGPGPLPVVVTPECSATDVLALLVAFCVSFPCPWRRRIQGAAAGVALLLAANVVRIASLASIAGTAAFLPVHTYVWPALLVLIALGYAMAWTWTAEKESGAPARRWLPFVVTAGSLSCLFVAVLPVISRSEVLGEATRGYAAAAASFLAAMGLAARAEGSTLATANGAFLVTPECLVTPLMPVFLGAALTLPPTWRRKAAAALAFAPAFAALAFARLLTLAVPASLLGSPLVAIHGFHQLLLGALLVLAAGLRGSREWPTRARRLAAAAAAAIVTVLAAPAYGAIVETEAALLARVLPHTLQRLDPPGDSQGALVLLPAFQVGVFAALALAAAGMRRWRAMAAGIAALHGGQIVLVIALGELAGHAGFTAPVTLVRVWALLAPVALFAVLRRNRPAIGTGNVHKPAFRTAECDQGPTLTATSL